MAFRSDDPPNNRLFILCQKGITEKEFRDKFGEFGKIEDIWIVKDKRTNEDRGIVYITFRKTSEAMLAMEEMNGRCMPGQPKPLKVVVANSRKEGSTRDPREDEKLVRLFVVCPKTFAEEDLKEEFEKYGDLDHVTVIRDRGTGESKGFGYVKYHRPYHAALAYEKCKQIFKPKFAEPQRSRDERENLLNSFYGFTSSLPTAGTRGGCDGDVLGALGETCQRQAEELASRPADNNTPQSTSCHLQIVASVGMNQAYLTKLFNLVPGMQYCDLNETTGLAYARYTTPQCALYARDKLNNFEYPIGSPLLVQLMEENLYTSSEPLLTADDASSIACNDELLAVHQRAVSLLEKAGINPQAVMAAAGTPGAMRGVGYSDRERVSYCHLCLPLPQPLAPDNCPIAQRLFIVCQPSAVSERILRDAFSRFGNLIDVFLLAGRNYGYAKYASKESAMKAIQILHGQNLAGQRVKVLEAEPPKGGTGMIEGPVP